MSFIIKETDNLLIRKFNTKDAKLLYENHTEEAFMKWFPEQVFGNFKEAKETIDYFNECYNNFELPLVFGIELKENGVLIGDTGINEVEGCKNEIEIGYSISCKFSNNGFASEALEAMTKFAFDRLEIQKLFGRVKKGNSASVRVLEKCNYLYDRIDLNAEDDPYGDGMVVYVNIKE